MEGQKWLVLKVSLTFLHLSFEDEWKSNGVWNNSRVSNWWQFLYLGELAYSFNLFSWLRKTESGTGTLKKKLSKEERIQTDSILKDSGSVWVNPQKWMLGAGDCEVWANTVEIKAALRV